MVGFLRRPSSSWTRQSSNNSRNTKKHNGTVNLASLAEQGKFDKFLKRLNEMDNEHFLLEQQHQQQQHCGFSSSSCRILQPSDNGNDSDSKENKQQDEETSNKTTSRSILHVALANRAPLRVVEALLRRIQECAAASSAVGEVSLVPEEILDDASGGKTPLHVAAESGCDVDVIERLLSGETLIAPAYTKDQLGRYPLHWASCLPHQSCKGNNKGATATGKQKKKNTKNNGNDDDHPVVCYYKGKREVRRETIHLLLQAHSFAAVIPDVYGMTPLDYARNVALLDPHTIHVLATVAKAHDDIRCLAKRGRAISKEPHISPVMLLSAHSSETTDNDDDDDSAVGINDPEYKDAAAGGAPAAASAITNSSCCLPEGMLTLRELRLEQDDVSSLGSQENQEGEEPSTTTARAADHAVVATYVRPFPGVVQ